MPIPTKLFSPNNGGGMMINGALTVLVNGRPACRFGDIVSGHGLHPPNPIVTASPSVIVEAKPQGYLTSLDACGHFMIPAEPNVLVSQK